MNAMVVVESLFGNTRSVADAIAEGLRIGGDAVVVTVGTEPPVLQDEVDLLVIGGPTHIHGMASERSRREAVEIAERDGLATPPAGPVLRNWVAGLGPGAGRMAATFDTRLGRSKLLTGSAADRLSRMLSRAGYNVVDEVSFVVEGTTGPLRDGELERAREWGRRLVEVSSPVRR